LRRREREKNKCGGEEEEKEEEEEEEPPSTIFPVRHMPPMEGLPDAGNCYDCKRSGIMKKAELITRISFIFALASSLKRSRN
jgi:hypothetical protein